MIFLGDTRPIFIRLRLDAGGKAFRTAWLDAVKALHAYLDRDGDGTLTKEEADRGSLPTMVRAATGGAAALPRADLDTNPKDGKVSLDELADVLRPALGPFRVQVGRLAVERNDALFNHLDRDKDGTLSQDELDAAVASLHRFDLDDDELIDATELEPFSNPIAMAEDDQTRRGRVCAGAAGDRAVGRRPVVPPRPAPAQEVRQGDGRGRVGRRQPAEPRRVRHRPQGLRLGRRRRATARSTPRSCAGSSAGSSPTWS